MTVIPVEESTVQKLDFTRNYSRLQELVKRRDLAAFMRTFTADFQQQELDGRSRNRADFESDYRQLMELPNLHYSDRMQTVDQKDRQATAEVEEIRSCSSKDDAGQAHSVEIITRIRHLWVQTDDGWQIQSARILSRTTRVDGSVKEEVPQAH